MVCSSAEERSPARDSFTLASRAPQPERYIKSELWSGRIVLKKRPIGVWIISSYIVASGILSLLAYGLAAAGLSPLPEHTAVFDSENLVPSLVTIGVALCGLIGGTLLFFLKNLSWLPFLTGAVVAAAGVALRNAGLAPDATNYVGPIVGIVIFTAIAIYATRVCKLNVPATSEP